VAPLKKQVTAAEAKIAELQKQLTAVQARLADPTLYTRNPAEAATLGRDSTRVSRAIAEAEESWLMASEAYEQAVASAS
jgi:ATP-binding cassette, subfamily F, member 3